MAIEQPEPYTENFTPSEQKEITADPGDVAIPKGRGLLTDMVFYHRGSEIPTLYSLWAGLFALSTAVKRDAWISWADKGLFANLYVILCGPAGIVKKGSAIETAWTMLENMISHMRDEQYPHYYEQFQHIKRLNLVHGKFTPEVLFSQMTPEQKHPTPPVINLKDQNGAEIKTKDGRPVQYRRTSESALILPEMAVSVGRQDYAAGLIELLLDLFDPKDETKKTTVGKGEIRLYRTYLSMLAATTRKGFESSMPRTALSDGFLSRTNVVYQSGTPRVFEEPWIPQNAPSQDELTRRLAWIAINTWGRYEFSDEANQWRKIWYRKFKPQLDEDEVLQGVKSRFAPTLYKLAFLIRIQRYDRSDRLIHVQDLEDANRLLDRTYTDAVPLMRVLLGGRYSEQTERVGNYIYRKKTVDRRTLLQNTHMNADEMDIALRQLLEQQKIIVVGEKGHTRTVPTRQGKEVYKWAEKDDFARFDSANTLSLPTVDWDHEKQSLESSEQPSKP